MPADFSRASTPCAPDNSLAVDQSAVDDARRCLIGLRECLVLLDISGPGLVDQLQPGLGCLSGQLAVPGVC